MSTPDFPVPENAPRNADGSINRCSAQYKQAQIDHQQREAMSAIERDRRIIQSAARMLPMTGSLTEERIGAVRKAAIGYIEANGLTHKYVSRAIGLKSASPVSQFLSGNYPGNNEGMARSINAWMDQHHRAKDNDRPQEFIMTNVVRHILTVIDETIRQQSVAVIYGPSGVSKTTVCIEACNTHFLGSVHVRCNSTCTSLATFSSLWCDALGLPNYGTNGQKFNRIVERLKDTGRCQLIDDAHKLLTSRSRQIKATSPHCKPLEFIFDVHDQAGVPVLLIGTGEIDQAIADEAMWAGQLSSRVSTRYSIAAMADGENGKPLFTKEDIVAFAQSLGPTFKLSPGAADEFTCMCNILGYGGLRRIGYLLSKAHSIMLARRKREQQDPGQITQEDIAKAMALNYGEQYAAYIRQRAKELRKAVA